MTKAYVLISPTVEEIRIYPEGKPETYCSPYGQSLMLYHRSCEPGTADITLHTSAVPHTRDTLRALRDALKTRGLTAVYSLRGGQHVIPGAEHMPDGSWKYSLV